MQIKHLHYCNFMWAKQSTSTRKSLAATFSRAYIFRRPSKYGIYSGFCHIFSCSLCSTRNCLRRHHSDLFCVWIILFGCSLHYSLSRRWKSQGFCTGTKTRELLDLTMTVQHSVNEGDTRDQHQTQLCVIPVSDRYKTLQGRKMQLIGFIESWHLWCAS